MDLLTASWLFSSLFILLSLGLYTIITLYFAKKQRIVRKDFSYRPNVTIIVPVHNEESVIEKKLRNIIQTEYPAEKIDNVIVLDDNSTDGTLHKVNSFLRETICPFHLDAIKYRGLPGKVRAINWILPYIKTDIVVITDADSVWNKDSLVHLLTNFSNTQVGAVTGQIVIEKDTTSFSGSIESRYRDIFHIWRLGEANIDSVALLNGPLYAFRRVLISEINEKCLDDGYVAFEVRKKGFRATYEPNAIVYERASSTLGGEIRQKMRRAKRYISVLLLNRDLLGKEGRFGKFIYPSMIILHIVLPFVLYWFIFSSLFMTIRYPYLLLLSLVLIFPKIRALFLSFIINQTALVLCHFLPPISSWEPIKNLRPN